MDEFLGQGPWMGSLGRVLGVISDGCMVGMGNLIWTIGCEGMIESEGAIGHLWGDQK